jgi:predicted O-methyltransferase YrrM
MMLKKMLRPLYVPIANWHYRTFRAPQRYKNLFKTIISLKAKNILEIGTWNGHRAAEMIRAASGSHPVANISYYGFDLFEEMDENKYVDEISKRPPSLKIVEQYLRQTGADIHLFKGNTLKTMPETAGALPKMDFIYIDGGHSHETIANDWKYSEMLMHEETVVIFDDYWLNREDGGCRRLIDSLDKNKYAVWLSEEIDKFNNGDFGRLEIRYAFVKKNN